MGRKKTHMYGFNKGFPFCEPEELVFHHDACCLKNVSCKVTNHVKICMKNQHVFVSFVFDIVGFLAPDATGEA